MTRVAGERLYLYAIVAPRPKAPLGRGAHGASLGLVRASGAWIVVERVVGEVRAGERAVRGHDRVVRRVAAGVRSTLPFRFGAFAASARALETDLAPLRASIGRALARVAGCVQYTLRVYGRAEPPGPRASLPPARGGAGESGPGTAWLSSRLAASRVPALAPLRDLVRPFVRDSRVEPSAHEPLLASVYDLVPRDVAAPYRRAVSRAARAVGADVRLRVSGPWPPYAFAELVG